MKISLSTEELLDGADQINARKEDIVQTLGLLRSQVMGVCDNWEGAAQSSFVTEFTTICDKFDEVFPDAVEEIAKEMKYAADTLGEVDATLGKRG